MRLLKALGEETEGEDEATKHGLRKQQQEQEQEQQPGQLLPPMTGVPRFPCLSMATKMGRVLADGMLETTLKAVEEGPGAWPFLSGKERWSRVGLDGGAAAGTSSGGLLVGKTEAGEGSAAASPYPRAAPVPKALFAKPSDVEAHEAHDTRAVGQRSPFRRSRCQSSLCRSGTAKLETALVSQVVGLVKRQSEQPIAAIAMALDGRTVRSAPVYVARVRGARRWSGRLDTNRRNGEKGPQSMKPEGKGKKV
ncbi:hypothetical protein CSOJ01_10870 [Colletotrichum sojae]|uniref:Uncharacterized protein n=1 Tax=Colletotrichum sojae TaxID=2175907 RepID=A0A8H6IZN7_9PEZI|nr:hypothetical protein CSOJ01_10870 [Colletotrichum sojae]